MMRSSRAMLADRERVSELRLGTDVVQRIQLNSRAKTMQSGEMSVDTGATRAALDNVTLQGYSDRLNSEERVPVVSATTALDLDDGMTVLLVFHKALYR
jgi:hypothetical protein